MSTVHETQRKHRDLKIQGTAGTQEVYLNRQQLRFIGHRLTAETKFVLVMAQVVFLSSVARLVSKEVAVLAVGHECRFSTLHVQSHLLFMVSALLRFCAV